MTTAKSPFLTPAADTSAAGMSFTGIATLLIAVSCVLHGVAIVTADPLQSANDRSRWCTVRSLVEQGTYRIDAVRQQPGWDTIDLIYYEGHFYSTKPPLMATWVAGVVWPICRITGWNFSADMPSINGTTLLLINGLPFVIGLIGFARWLQRTVQSRWAAIFVLAVAAFGTLLSPFLTTLNNHSQAAAAVLLAMLCWQRSPATTTAGQVLRFGLWGLFASWAACHDLPATAFTAAMLLAAFRENPKLTLTAFVPATSIPAIAFLACNAAALGGLVPAYSGYGGETYRFLYEGVPSYWLQPQGVDRGLDSPFTYFFNCTFGHHGWWLLTPVWTFVAVQGLWATRTLDRVERQTVWGTWLLSAIVIGFYLLRTENYNYGGVSCGLRWALFLTPLWLMSLAIALDRIPERPWLQAIAVLLLAGSVFSAWFPMNRAWQQPWAFQLADRWGWLPGRNSHPLLERPLFSWISQLPAAPSAGSPIWVEFRRERPPADIERLRLTLRSDRMIGSRRCAALTIERFVDDSRTDLSELLIDRTQFQSGQSPAKCLVWTDAKVTPVQQQSDLALFRGLPLLKEYSPGPERYTKLPLRTDAFACQRVAAQCDYSPAAGLPKLRYRCDLWLSPEIPFGTARFERTISDPLTSEIQQRETWIASGSFPPVASTSPVTIEMFNSSTPIITQLRQ